MGTFFCGKNTFSLKKGFTTMSFPLYNSNAALLYAV